MTPTIIDHDDRKEDHNQCRDDGSTPRRRRPKPPPLSISSRRPMPLVSPSSVVVASSSPSSKIKESSSSSSSSSESEELERLVHAPPFWKNNKKRLSKQLSMCETPRDRAWEKRRHQIIRQESRRRRTSSSDDLNDDITDEDLHELKACIELGFGFNEEEGQRLCNTLPALDLYFAVTRQLSPSPVSTPNSDSASGSGGGSNSLGGRSSSFDHSPSPGSEDSWKICCPGDNPQQVKTKLRHWAQAVACSVMQSYS